jgi:hypothetical protein
MVMWITGFSLNLILFYVLIRKKRYQTVRWFTILIGQDVLQTLLLFLVHSSAGARFLGPGTYFYTYWVFEAIDSFLRVMVIWEVAQILLEQCLGLKLYEEIKNYWGAFLAIAAALISLLTFTSTSPHFAVRFALRIGQISTIGVGGLILMLLSLTFFFGVKATIHAQAIVYGLGLYMFGQFLVNGIVMVLGTGVWRPMTIWIKPIYLVCLIIWIVSLWREEPEEALPEDMYRLVQLGRAGVHPPIPAGVQQRLRRRSRLVYLIGGDDPLNQTVADNLFWRKLNKTDALDATQDPDGLFQTGRGVAR